MAGCRGVAGGRKGFQWLEEAPVAGLGTAGSRVGRGCA